MPIDPRMAACILNSSIFFDYLIFSIDREDWKVTDEILSIAALL
jgi:hypothetical protein